MFAARWLWYRRWRRCFIKPGDIYEDCSYHPCVCLIAQTYCAPRGWRRWLGYAYDADLTGISLWDLSIRSCSARHCAPDRMNSVDLLVSLYYHNSDKTLLNNPELQESIQQWKDSKLAAEYIPVPAKTESEEGS